MHVLSYNATRSEKQNLSIHLFCIIILTYHVECILLLIIAKLCKTKENNPPFLFTYFYEKRANSTTHDANLKKKILFHR